MLRMTNDAKSCRNDCRTIFVHIRANTAGLDLTLYIYLGFLGIFVGRCGFFLKTENVSGNIDAEWPSFSIPLCTVITKCLTTKRWTHRVVVGRPSQTVVDYQSSDSQEKLPRLVSTCLLVSSMPSVSRASVPQMHLAAACRSWHLSATVHIYTPLLLKVKVGYLM